MEINEYFEVQLTSTISKEFQPAFNKMTQEDWQMLAQKASGEIYHPDPERLEELKWLEKIKDQTNE